MYVSVCALIFAAVAIAAPAPDAVAKRASILARGTAALDANIFDQGDGFYTAVYNDTTAALDVAFVPIAKADLFTAPMPAEKRSTNDMGALNV